MHKMTIPFEQIPQLSKADVAYATGDPLLRDFYREDPTPEGLLRLINTRDTDAVPRTDLVKVLREQYAALSPKPLVEANIQALANPNTYTVCTAHQPALLLGPLYVVYKAATTINLALRLSELSGRRVIPVFVMGSEDHDLDELNHARIFGKKLQWSPSGAPGPIGRYAAHTLDESLAQLREWLGDQERGQALYARIAACRESSATFADFTRALLHDLLGEQGLVVADFDRPELKRHLIPILRDDLTNHSAYRIVTGTIEALQERGFKPQAPPREINMFYFTPEGGRERVVREGAQYRVHNSDLVFTQAEILRELEEHPERFSPNVVLRPLYQEILLPNLAYVGGGGELAYWLERKALFAHYGVSYPILVRRNSALWLDKDSVKRMLKYPFRPERYFEPIDRLARDYVAELSETEITLERERKLVDEVFASLSQKAAAVDPSLSKAALADGAKTLALLEQWRQRLIKTEKQRHEQSLIQLRALREKLFPDDSLQERKDNHIAFLFKYGDEFTATLRTHFDPFEAAAFVVLQDL
ncbi:MAG: bacillithiol biosynthesis cysteine-adding enzyme BshC [Saprospiraceae bacterium]